MRSMFVANTDAHRVRLDGTLCVYCGEIADTIDHFPPRTVSAHGFLLPACRECNTAAGDRNPSDFHARCLAAKDAIKQKYHFILGTPDWSKDEMRYLGRNLRSKVAAWQKARALLKDRLSWNVDAYIAHIDLANAFANFRADKTIHAAPETARARKASGNGKCEVCGAGTAKRWCFRHKHQMMRDRAAERAGRAAAERVTEREAA